MRVLEIVGSNFYPGSGIYSIVNPLVEELNKNSGFEVGVLCLEKSDDQNKNTELLYFNNEYSLFTKYDLCVFHGVYEFSFIRIAWFLEAHKIRYLIKPHSSLMKASLLKHPLRKHIFINLFRGFFTKSSGILFTNRHEQQNSLSRLSQVSFLEMNGLRLNHYSEKIQNDGTRLFFLSRIDIHHKGLDHLLLALKELTTYLNQEKVRLSIHGKGNLKDVRYVDRMIKSIGSKNIVFFNSYVFGISRNNLFMENDIMIITSRYEGFPAIISEVLMAGIPVIYTNGTNANDLESSRIGWQTTTKPKDIRETIIRAVSEYNVDKVGYHNRCKKYAQDNFNIINTVKNTMEIYENVGKTKYE